METCDPPVVLVSENDPFRYFIHHSAVYKLIFLHSAWIWIGLNSKNNPPQQAINCLVIFSTGDIQPYTSPTVRKAKTINNGLSLVLVQADSDLSILPFSH